MKDKKITLELTDEEFLKIAKMAHEFDITFNHMAERILTNYLFNEIEHCSHIIKKDYTCRENINSRRHRRKNPKI